MPIQVEQPLAYYGTLSAAMGACLYLFVSVARDAQSVKSRFDRRMMAAEQHTGVIGAQLASLETRLGEWAGRTGELEQKVAGLAAVRRTQTMAAGVDANQRTQVLRLARRGDRPDQIASELRVPRSEVELLLKVQRAVVRAF